MTFEMTDDEHLKAIIELHNHMVKNSKDIKVRRDELVNEMRKVIFAHASKLLNSGETPPDNALDNYKRLKTDEFILLSALSKFTADVFVASAMCSLEDFKREILHLTETFSRLFAAQIETALRNAAKYEAKANAVRREVEEEDDQLHMAGRSNKANE